MLPAHPAALMIAHYLCLDAELQRIAGPGTASVDDATEGDTFGDDASDDASNASGRDASEWVVVIDDDLAFTVPAGGAAAIAGTVGAQLLEDDGRVAVHIVPIPDRAMVQGMVAETLAEVGAAVLAGAPPLAAYGDLDPDELHALRAELAAFAASYAPSARGDVGGALLALAARDLDAAEAGPATEDASAFLAAELAERDPAGPDAFTPAGAEALLDTGGPAALLSDPEMVESSSAVWGVAAALYAALEQRAAEG